MYSVKEMFDDIVLIADLLEENDIENWEKQNNVLLPDGKKIFSFWLTDL